MGFIQKPYRGTSLNPSHPLARGLVGAWAMNAGSGLILQDSCRRYPLSLISSAQWIPGGVVGDDSSNYYAESSADYTPGSSPHTFFVKYKSTEANTTVAHPIICIYTATTASALILQIFRGLGTNNGRIRVYKAQGDDTLTAAALNALDGKLHTIAMVDDGIASTNINIYYEGKFHETASHANFGNALNTAQKIRLFYMGNADYILDGAIEVAYIYNRVLTAAEIAWLHREPYAMFDWGLPIWAMYQEAAAGSSITKDGAISPAGAITRLGQFNRAYGGAI